MGADAPGHHRDRGAARGGRQPDGVLDTLGEALDAEGVAHDGLAKLGGAKHR